MDKATAYTKGDDRLYLDDISTPVVITTTSNFRLITGEILHNKETGESYKFLHLLGQQGDFAYLLVLPITPAIAAD